MISHMKHTPEQREDGLHVEPKTIQGKFMSAAWSSSSRSVQTLLLYSTLLYFFKYSPQSSQIQYLEEASTGLCVKAIP